MRRNLLAAGLVLAAALAGPVAGLRAEDAPVKMAPFAVSTGLMNIEVKIGFRSDYSGQWVDNIKIRRVKSPSNAQRAGLTKGMEVLAIQGQPVHGLTQPELSRVLRQEVEKEVVLVVRDSAAAPQREIRVGVSAEPKK